MIAVASTNGHLRTTQQASINPSPNGLLPSSNGENKQGDRGANGRFVIGNKGGPGNPFSRQVADLRKAFLEAATPDRMKELSDELFTQAKAGDVAAAKLLLSYVLGKPADVPNPDRTDLDAMQILRAWPSAVEATTLLLNLVAPGCVLDLCQGSLESSGGEVKAGEAKLLDAATRFPTQVQDFNKAADTARARQYGG
jgi:hypothetical protein